MWMLSPFVWLSFAGYGYWIASIKRRNPFEGVIYGLTLGPIGCVVEAALRARTQEEVAERWLRRLELRRIQWKEARDWQARHQAETRRRRRAAQVRAEVARARRAEAWDRFSVWFKRTILEFGWYKALPEFLQPIVVGLVVALPVVVVLIVLFGGR